MEWGVNMMFVLLLQVTVILNASEGSASTMGSTADSSNFVLRMTDKLSS
jgi:hypothetical protein